MTIKPLFSEPTATNFHVETVDTTAMDPIVFSTTYDYVEKALAENGMRIGEDHETFKHFPFRLLTKSGSDTGIGFSSILEMKEWVDAVINGGNGAFEETI